jgi:hypothetical protein
MAKISPDPGSGDSFHLKIMWAPKVCIRVPVKSRSPAEPQALLKGSGGAVPPTPGNIGSRRQHGSKDSKTELTAVPQGHEASGAAVPPSVSDRSEWSRGRQTANDCWAGGTGRSILPETARPGHRGTRGAATIRNMGLAAARKCVYANRAEGVPPSSMQLRVCI